MNNENRAVNKALREAFLDEARPIPKQFRVENRKELFGYIYCIENLLDGKKYIGSTYSTWSGIKNPNPYGALQKRASHYLYEYNTLKNGNTPSTKAFVRPIIQAMLDDDFESFVMYPVAETTMKNHSEMEIKFIKMFNTYGEGGYNITKGGTNSKHIGRILTTKDKLTRSKGIIAVSMNSKQLVFADSMKLFADYLGTTKDIIKNSTRYARPYKKWFCFYLDNNERAYTLNHYVLGDGITDPHRRHSEKAKVFYKELCDAVSMYFYEYPKSEYFADFEVLPPLEYTEGEEHND